jgi:hypothetical protein
MLMCMRVRGTTTPSAYATGFGGTGKTARHGSRPLMLYNQARQIG